MVPGEQAPSYREIHRYPPRISSVASGGGARSEAERLTLQRVLQYRGNPVKDETPGQDRPDGATQRRPDTWGQPGYGCRHRERRDRREQARGREAGFAPEVEVVEEDKPKQADRLRAGADEEEPVGHDRPRRQPQPTSQRIRGKLEEAGHSRLDGDC